jgi:thioesterase domain-containing protein
LRMWLRIEEELASRLPVDHLEFNMTPSRLTCIIQKLLQRSAGRLHAGDPVQHQALVFLMPPAHGYTQPLAQFRAALKDKIQFSVIQYPQMDELIEGSGKFDVLVDAAVAQIRERGDQEIYHLAGYSFGGFVALEVARRLRGEGRTIGFLGLIDTRLMVPPRQRRGIFAKAKDYIFGWHLSPPILLSAMMPGKESPRATRPAISNFCTALSGACAAAYEDFQWWLVEKIARNLSWGLLRKLDQLMRSAPGSSAFALRLELVARLRLHALQRLTVKPVNVPATLFRSEEWCTDAPDHGWGRIFERLKVLPIRGSHLTVFEPEFRTTLCLQFWRAVEASCGPRRKDQEPAQKYELQ